MLGRDVGLHLYGCGAASLWMWGCIPGSKMSWRKPQQPCGAFLCFRFDPCSLSLLKLILVGAGESLSSSVPPGCCLSPCAVCKLLGKQEQQQQLLTRWYSVLDPSWQCGAPAAAPRCFPTPVCLKAASSEECGSAGNRPSLPLLTAGGH